MNTNSVRQGYGNASAESIQENPGSRDDTQTFRMNRNLANPFGDSDWKAELDDPRGNSQQPQTSQVFKDLDPSSKGLNSFVN